MDDSNRLLLVKSPPITRKAITGVVPIDDNDEEVIATGDAYATVKGQRQADSLRFLRHNRRSFTMPYDYLPVPWWESPLLLLLEYPGFFTVALHGKSLDELEPRISNRQLTWLRECGEAEAASLPLAVFRIDILHGYPSREEEAIRPDL
jgi:hypothetical protein